MKKLLVVLFAICLLLAGCSSKSNNNVVFDCVEYDTIEEMNEAAKTNIVSAGVSGKSLEKYCVISSSIAQYTFTCNDEDWCVRASTDVDNDISGLYYDSIGFEKDVNATYYTDDYYVHRFFYDNVQYVISLNVKDKDISMAHFDDVSSELQTSITGVKSGYENELYEDGDNVIYKVVYYQEDGSTITMEIIYAFENDKMVSITNNNIFETVEAAKAYYDELIKAGYNVEDITLNENVIISISNNVDFYSDMTKAEFKEMMQSSMMN